MKFRVGACALLVCLAGCTAEAPDTKFGDQKGAASANARTAQRLPSVQAGRQASQSVANAPDRGELISYKNKGAASKQEGAYTWYPIAISEAHALKAVVDGVMTIPSPDGSQVKVRYERHIEHPDGNWTWIGRVIGGDQKQEAILTFGEKAVFGSIPQKTGAPLNLQTRSGMLYAVATDQSKVKNPNSRTDMMVPPAAAFHSTLLASASKAQVSQSAVETKAASAATTVDVALGYSAGLRAVYGSQSATVTRLVNLVDVGNQAFTNSFVNGALRIVSAVEVNYADNTTNKAALSELTGVDENEVIVPIPASLTPLRNARNDYGADLAVLVRKFQTPENAGCGIAWLNGSGGEPINPATDDDFGFAVISDGSDSEGTNTYFCADETLVHELGHLMGSAHDRDNSKKTDGSQLFGRFPYSFGLKTTTTNGNFYTIMAYGSDGQNFYRTFSNPLVLKCGTTGNLACGIADQADNARSLNQTIPVVATFRISLVPHTSVLLDLTAIAKRGGSTTTELHTLNGGAGFGSYTRHLTTALPQSGSDKAWNFQFGDYNKDGVQDMYAIKKNGSSNTTEMHILSGATGFKTFLLQTATGLAAVGTDNSWIFRLGDENGDGNLDLYAVKRIGSSQRTEVHVLNGANGFKTFLSQKATALENTGANNAWEFELGDYNGDGKVDIYVMKKISSSTTTELHVLNGADGYQTFLAHIATGIGQAGDSNVWNFKVGDYNRDGVLDLYCVNRVGNSGTTELHVLDGYSGFGTFTAHIATALGPVGDNNEWEFVLTPNGS